MVCPTGDQYVPVSTTTRPVTQTAEVAVKSAEIKFVLCPVADENGKVSKKAPVKMVNEKPKTKICVGFMLSLLKIVYLLINFKKFHM